jgi:hypothetical protein
MADGILDGISNAVGGVGDFFLNRGRYADPNAMNAQFGVPEQDVRQAGINTLANVSALLLAAGQPMTGNQRAQLLAGIGPALGGMQTDIFKASQARLMTAQQREKVDELREIQAINDRRRTDPASLAKAMGLSEDLVKTMDGRTLRDIAKQVTIKRASTSPAQQAASARLAQIMGIGGAPAAAPAPAGGAPSPAAAVGEQAAEQAAPAAAPATPVATAPASPVATGASMTPAMARAIASDRIILAGNPDLAKKYAEIAEKLETPGAKEAQILTARRDAERIASIPKLELSLANRQLQTKTVSDTIDAALQDVRGFTLAGLPTAGVGGALASAVPGTDAYNLRRRIETIKSNIGFSELQKMRDESPTGGALGQVAVQELNYLQAALGNLDQAQSVSELEKNLKSIKSIMQRYEKIRLNAFERQFGRKPEIDKLLRNPEEVEDKAAAAGATPPAQSPGSAPRVTREQFNALPSGSLFIAADDPTGQIRRKP